MKLQTVTFTFKNEHDTVYNVIFSIKLAHCKVCEEDKPFYTTPIFNKKIDEELAKDILKRAIDNRKS